MPDGRIVTGPQALARAASGTMRQGFSLVRHRSVSSGFWPSLPGRRLRRFASQRGGITVSLHLDRTSETGHPDQFFVRGEHGELAVQHPRSVLVTLATILATEFDTGLTDYAAARA